MIAITTPWDVYRSIPTQLGPEPPRAIIDCWRVLDPTTLSAITEYIVPGVGR